MATNTDTPDKISLFPDQLSSLLSLARVLPARKYPVILALLHYLQRGSLKSTATRNQIEEFTGLKKRTIYTYIQEFERCGLIKQWRGPFNLKQKFYVVNLPVRQEVFDFYGMTTEPVCPPQEQAIPDDSKPSKSTVPIYPSPAQNTGMTRQTAPTGITDASSSQVSPQESSDFTFGDASDSGEYEAKDPVNNAPAGSESFFSDPLLDLLVHQVEEGRKDNTRLFRWLWSQNLLTYYPPTDGYRVEKELLQKRIGSLDELSAVLTAPVQPEYQWFVAEFLQCCHDNGYGAEDTSQEYAFEINVLLDSMLRPRYGGRAEWTPESMKAQLRYIIEEWTKLKSWKANLTTEPPAVPTLAFLVTDTAIWRAARERWSDENESKLSAIFDRFQTGV
jgi:hypothetical protein